MALYESRSKTEQEKIIRSYRQKASVFCTTKIKAEIRSTTDLFRVSTSSNEVIIMVNRKPSGFRLAFSRDFLKFKVIPIPKSWGNTFTPLFKSDGSVDEGKYKELLGNQKNYDTLVQKCRDELFQNLKERTEDEIESSILSSSRHITEGPPKDLNDKTIPSNIVPTKYSRKVDEKEHIKEVYTTNDIESLFVRSCEENKRSRLPRMVNTGLAKLISGAANAKNSKELCHSIDHFVTNGSLWRYIKRFEDNSTQI